MASKRKSNPLSPAVAAVDAQSANRSTSPPLVLDFSAEPISADVARNFPNAKFLYRSVPDFLNKFPGLRDDCVKACIESIDTRLKAVKDVDIDTHCIAKLTECRDTGRIPNSIQFRAPAEMNFGDDSFEKALASSLTRHAEGLLGPVHRDFLNKLIEARHSHHKYSEQLLVNAHETLKRTLQHLCDGHSLQAYAIQVTATCTVLAKDAIVDHYLFHCESDAESKVSNLRTTIATRRAKEQLRAAQRAEALRAPQDVDMQGAQASVDREMQNIVKASTLELERQLKQQATDFERLTKQVRLLSLQQPKQQQPKQQQQQQSKKKNPNGRGAQRGRGAHPNGQRPQQQAQQQAQQQQPASTTSPPAATSQKQTGGRGKDGSTAPRGRGRASGHGRGQ